MSFNQERANMYYWLREHLDYSPDKKTGRYFWEYFDDARLLAIYNEYLNKGYSRDGYLVHLKKGTEKRKSYAQLYMEYQQESGDMRFTWSDLEKIKFKRLKEMCEEKGLLPDRKKKVIAAEPAPQKTLDQANEVYRQMTIFDLEQADMADDLHEEFLTLEEIIEMQGVEVTDEDIESIQENGIRVVDSIGGSKPYSQKREALKSDLIELILKIYNNTKYKGNKYNKEQLYRLNLSDLMILYSSLRRILNEEELKEYPESTELETNIRFGK